MADSTLSALTAATSVSASDLLYLVQGGTNDRKATISQIVVTSSMLAGSIPSSKLVGTDIVTVGTIATGTWQGTAVGIGYGGTGQTTQQAAIDALTGTQSAGKYLRSDGTHATLASIQAADVPTLNQSTTGTAANVTGTVAVANGGTGQTTAAAAWQALHPTIVTATYGATTTFDLSQGDVQTVTLTGASTLALSNTTGVRQFTLVLTQDATGGRTVTWFSGISWPGGTVPTLSTGASKRDVFTFIQISSGSYLGFLAGANL